MPVIHEMHSQPALGIFQKECLTIVCVSRANVDKPGKPEAFKVAHSLETGLRKDFEKAYTWAAQESRPEAHQRLRPKTSLGSLQPAVRILVQKRVENQQRFPGRNLQPTSAVEFVADTLIEAEVGSLQIIGELDYVKQAVASLS